MKVIELIEKLKEFPQDMPVAVFGEINWIEKDDPDAFEVSIRTWTHTNYPYNKPDFNYVDIH